MALTSGITTASYDAGDPDGLDLGVPNAPVEHYQASSGAVHQQPDPGPQNPLTANSHTSKPGRGGKYASRKGK
jgi:hypothetical protein